MDSGNGQAVEYLKPQFDTKIKQLDTQVAQMKTNIDNNITKLVNAKNQVEYSKIYEPLQKDLQAYQHAKNIVDRIKVHANNGDFKSVANDFGNFVSGNLNLINKNTGFNLTKMVNNFNNATNKNFVNDGAEFWNASVNNLNTDYIRNNNGIDKVNTRITYKQSSRDKAYKIAYYLSKYGQYELFPDLNQTEALKKCSEIINVKSSTLKVYMNSFDPFTGSGRKSFKGLDLNDNMKKIFKDYNNKDENTIRIELKNILNL